MTQKQTLLLVILDGYGYSEDNYSNAISSADTPVLDRMLRDNPNSLISGSGLDVGLPDKQMGNSEVGHMNLGSGRIVYQDFTRISKSITDKSFFKNSELLTAFSNAKQKDSAVHILGMLSPGGVHSHQEHIYAAIEIAKQQNFKKLYLHIFTDGRDTPPKSAKEYIDDLEKYIKKANTGSIASVSGRYYAMDRDNRWDRIQLVYDLLTKNEKPNYKSASHALKSAYNRDETDEFITPSKIENISIKDNDAVIFMNFRADRALQISKAFVDTDFNSFERKVKPKLSSFVTATQYSVALPVTVAFPPVEIKNSLGEILEKHDKTQLRIAETEKYAHVTYFFNGGKEQPFKKEDRILIKSPEVKTYDLQPEMSAIELTKQLIVAIKSKKYDFIVCNYANCDMVGHTGDFNATVKAVETIDHCLSELENTLLEARAQALITADHGNAEKMKDKNTNQPHTAHTCNPVPLIYIGGKKSKIKKWYIS